MSSVVTARSLLGANGILEDPLVSIDDGYITSLRRRESDELPSHTASGGTIHCLPDAMLVPSYLDIHVHGAAGYDVMEGTMEALHSIEAYLASRGVGGFFPTTITASREDTLRALDRLADRIEGDPPSDGAVPLGIHLEGPFLSPAKRGVHPAALLLAPSISTFESFRQAARGHLRLLTIAPELPGSVELIQYATTAGVTCSLGHSDATAAEAAAGFHAGARSATHTFNAMRRLDHRDPGLAAYVLDNDELFAEIICDGVHVDPAMVRLFFKAKGIDRSILVTDGISAMGRKDGKYKLGELEVDVSNGRCTAGGALAGSVITLDRALRNFSDFTRLDISSAVPLVTRNPAKLMGLEDRWGLIEEGRQANITALSPSGEILQVFRAGRPLFA